MIAIVLITALLLFGLGLCAVARRVRRWEEGS
jgi:hypothetical protein